MENRFLARLRPRLEQVSQSEEMDCGEFEKGDMAQKKSGPIWPLFAWILTTAVVTVLISILFDAEYRAMAQIVGGVAIGAILFKPFMKLVFRKKEK